MARGRPRKIDPDIALQRAMEVFWNNGFEGTSLSDLVTATEMAKPGLYATFGDKEQLYKKTLHHYYKVWGKPQIDALGDPSKDLKIALRTYYKNTIKGLIQEPSSCGCFVVNNLVDCANGPKELEKLGRTINNQRLTAFLERFEVAQTKGEISKTANVAALADFFSSQTLALAVLHRTGAREETLNHVVDIAMTTLENKGP